VALIVVGIGCLALSDRDHPALIVAGLVSSILGSLLLGPLAIRAFSVVAGRLSIAPRLALRDLARYQARSGAALAAVTLSLGIAAAVVVVASAEEAKLAKEPQSLSDRQIRIFLGPPDARELTPVDAPTRLGRLAAAVDGLAAKLDGATTTPLAKAVTPGGAPGIIEGTRVFHTVELTRRFDDPEGRRAYRSESQLYVATPPVLDYLGIDPATIAPGADFLVDRRVDTDGLLVPGMTSREELVVEHVQKIDVGRHLFGSDSGRKPANFVTLGGLRRNGWQQVPAGWLVESNRPLTGDQVGEARDIAAEAGLTVEARRQANTPTEVMSIATAAGAVLAMAILAMTVGLIRSESAGDLRTLTATGATPRIRRTLTATTAGALALLGAALGVGGAYVVLSATYHDDLAHLGDVPVPYLVLMVLVLPALAAAAGWLLAGREPPVIPRRVVD
jgi:putative ABC transport system permease protein